MFTFYQNKPIMMKKVQYMKKLTPIQPKPKSKYDNGKRDVFSVRLPEKLISKIHKEAERTNYSTTEIIEMILDKYFEIADN